jgi:hypothetical protein
MDDNINNSSKTYRIEFDIEGDITLVFFAVAPANMSRMDLEGHIADHLNETIPNITAWEDDTIQPDQH